MYTKQLSVRDLRKHWEDGDKLEEGESMVGVPLSLLPPWTDLCSKLSWKLCLVDNRDFTKKQYGHCGVYRLVALGPEGDFAKPLTLNRVCGQDITGTLYIGRAAWLNERLNGLRRSLRVHRPEYSHRAAHMLRSIPSLNALAGKLAVALLFTGKETRSVEINLIEAYMNSFGDTPPLNYNT